MEVEKPQAAHYSKAGADWSRLPGTGGSGKTSLSLVLGRSLVESFARGVFFVQLGNINSAELDTYAICQTIGIQEVAGLSANKSIRNSIGNAHLLLILSTLNASLPELLTVTSLIKECPNLTFIITSRRPLGVEARRKLS